MFPYLCSISHRAQTSADVTVQFVLISVFFLLQDWSEKEEGGWRKRTEGNDREWRRPVADRCVLFV